MQHNILILDNEEIFELFEDEWEGWPGDEAGFLCQIVTEEMWKTDVPKNITTIIVKDNISLTHNSVFVIVKDACANAWSHTGCHYFMSDAEAEVIIQHYKVQNAKGT